MYCRCNPDDDLRRLERAYYQDPTLENRNRLNDARLRAGLSLVLRAKIPDDWKEFAEAYPPTVVHEMPADPLLPYGPDPPEPGVHVYTDFFEAEGVLDKLEEFWEEPFRVVYYDHYFYIITKEEFIRLTGRER